MYTGPLVFTQVMDFMPSKTFQRCVEKYQGNFSIKNFTCLDQFRIMVFAQLTYRVPIPLISPPDSEGIRHAIPKDVATLFRIMSPPLGSERSDAGF